MVHVSPAPALEEENLLRGQEGEGVMEYCHSRGLLGAQSCWYQEQALGQEAKVPTMGYRGARGPAPPGPSIQFGKLRHKKLE